MVFFFSFQKQNWQIKVPVTPEFIIVSNILISHGIKFNIVWVYTEKKK